MGIVGVIGCVDFSYLLDPPGNTEWRPALVLALLKKKQISGRITVLLGSDDSTPSTVYSLYLTRGRLRLAREYEHHTPHPRKHAPAHPPPTMLLTLNPRADHPDTKYQTLLNTPHRRVGRSPPDPDTPIDRTASMP